MSIPPPLGSGILLDQILVGGAASLLNLIIHAILLGAVVWTVRRLEVKDTFVPSFVQYTIVIVSTGALLVAGHFLEVVTGPSPTTWSAPRPATPTASISPSATTPRSATATSLGVRLAIARADDGAELHHADRLVHGAHYRIAAPRRTCGSPEGALRSRNGDSGKLGHVVKR